MSAADTIEQVAGASPDRKVRFGGGFHLAGVVAGLCAVSAGFALIARSASTSTSILAARSLFRSGFAAELLAIAGSLVVVPFFYRLFRSESSGISFLAAFVAFVGNAVLALNTLNLAAPLLLLRGARSLNVIELEQLQTTVLLFLKFHGRGHIIGLTCFGFYCLLIGALFVRSAMLPHLPGVLMAIAGLAWLTDSLVNLLSPSLLNNLFPYLLAPALLGGGSLCLWLLGRAGAARVFTVTG